MARMRYAAQALELIREEDPDSAVTLNYIRSLASSGKIPVHRIGRRKLINCDALLEYLAQPEQESTDWDQKGKIRMIPERGEQYGYTRTKR
ncbi:MAG TPA: hypothetical protein DIW17_03990 [Clostridiales bacterium]|nr:hypothetical protein [Clostridiales bacterium]